MLRYSVFPAYYRQGMITSYIYKIKVSVTKQSINSCTVTDMTIRMIEIHVLLDSAAIPNRAS